ncbi:MAG TPA: cobalamin-dependent protein [Spirochaetia bacterium]|nr:cobalamin-dependent protein [Spirochaetia bacterium]
MTAKERLVDAISDMQEEEAIKLVKEMLEAGTDPQVILDASREAMAIVGNRYERKEYFLPELIIAGDLLKEIGILVKPRLKAKGTGKSLGKVLLGTVAGDIHDIGKDVVGFMLDVNNFEVRDVGVDVPSDVFVKNIREFQPDIVGMSGFLTQAFDQMKHTVEAIEKAGLRGKVKIMIGGAIMDASVAQYVGADAYGADAAAAVKLATSWI